MKLIVATAVNTDYLILVPVVMEGGRLVRSVILFQLFSWCWI